MAQSWTGAVPVGHSEGMEMPLEALAEPQGHRLRELLGLAGDEARRLGHHYVGTRHVAVAALHMSGEEGAVVDARSRLEGLLGRGTAQADDPLWATPGLVRLVQRVSCLEADDDLVASDLLSAIRRLHPAVARTVLGE